MRHETLMQAQLSAYPDTRVLTDDEVADLLYVGFPDWLKGLKVEDWSQAWCYDNEMDRKGAFGLYIELEVARARCSWARGAFMNRAQSPDGFFYACGKRDDGTYRNVGFRYGLSEHEYASGFCGLTFTAQGE